MVLEVSLDDDFGERSERGKQQEREEGGGARLGQRSVALGQRLIDFVEILSIHPQDVSILVLPKQRGQIREQIESRSYCPHSSVTCIGLEQTLIKWIKHRSIQIPTAVHGTLILYIGNIFYLLLLVY